MKKWIAIILCLCSIALVGCGGRTDNPNGRPPEEDTLKSVEEILEEATPSELKCDKYQMKKYTRPYWKNQIIYNETVMFISDANGSVPAKSLAFPIAKILEVRDSTLETLYTEGTDYRVTADGDLEVVEGGNIPVTAYDDYYLKEDKVGGIGAMSKSQEGRFLDYGEGDYFYKKQVCVTYIRTEEYKGAQPEFSSDGLSKTIAKLKAREDLNFVFYGDSITTGCNASGNYDALPNMPRFDEMVVARLKDWYQYDATNITLTNTAVGGWLSDNGKGEFTERVLNYNPDLVAIGFGMNDGTWNVPAETFGINIDFMIQKLKAQNPDCEVILLSTMLPNPDATTAENGDYLKSQKDYLPILKEIASGYEGIVVADITSMHEELLKRKDYCDMTGNNINHPSDFLVRVYAQVILSHLIEDFR